MLNEEQKGKIFQFRTEGLSIRKIAETLSISADTVQRHIGNMKEAIDAQLRDQREAFLKKMKIDRESRLSALANMEKQISQKLQDADWSKLPADRIGKLWLSLIQEVRAENLSSKFVENSIVSGPHKPGVVTYDYHQVDP